MKKIKKLLVIAIIISCMFTNIGSIKAAMLEIPVNSYNDIPPLDSQDYIFEKETNMLSKDKALLHVFTGEDEGWVPRIKFEGTDKNNIQTYLFCLSYHDKAPSSSIKYTLQPWDDMENREKMNQVRYIMEHGFGIRDYSSDYSLLIEDYYITQLAIWQLQGESGYVIEEKRINVLTDEMDKKYNEVDGTYKDSQPNTASAYQRIKKLVNDAKNPEINPNDKTKLLAKFVPLSNPGYQILVPFKVYKLPTPEEPKPEKHYCEVVDGTYYGRNGGVVDEYTYKATCESTSTILTKWKISYRDKCTKEAMKDVQMSLYRGSSCSGVALENWTTGSPYQINNLPSGQYTVCDAKYGNSLTFDVKETTDLQTFEFTTNPETCEPEVIPNTGIISYTLIGGSLVLISGFYFYLRKKGVFVKIK